MRTIFSLILLTLFSCKDYSQDKSTSTTDKSIPKFEMSANRNVEISIDEETKYALEDLSLINLKYETDCNETMQQTYNVDFYFEISQDSKDLIIIIYYSNPCKNEDVNKYIEKYTIPISKIKSIDVETFDPYHINGNSKEFNMIFINMQYNSDTITKEYVESGIYNNKIVYTEKTIKVKNVILEARKEICVKIKNDIDLLVKKFKI